MDSIKFEFGSAKNIPLANKKEYFEMMIQALEKFNRNLSWHLFFKLNPHLVSKGRETFGFNSSRAPTRMKELKEFEKDLVKLFQSIKFRKRSNQFLTTLKKEMEKILDKKELIVPADKTSNKYLVPPKKYLNMLEKEIQKNYKKEDLQNVKIVNDEDRKTAEDLEIGDRMYIVQDYS